MPNPENRGPAGPADLDATEAILEAERILGSHYQQLPRPAAPAGVRREDRRVVLYWEITLSMVALVLFLLMLLVGLLWIA